MARRIRYLGYCQSTGYLHQLWIGHTCNRCGKNHHRLCVKHTIMICQ